MRADLESLGFYLEYLKQKYIIPFEKALAEVKSLIKGAQQAVSYEDYETLVSALSILAKDHYDVGQSIYVETFNVPDLWVSKILDEFTPFVYVNDEQFVLELAENGHIDIGFFRLARLEYGKVNLPDYVKFTDFMSTTKAGVARCRNTNYGLYMAENGETLAVSRATNAEIEAKTNIFKPIVPAGLDHAWKVGATTNTEIFTEEEKTSACELIGAVKQQKPTKKNSFWLYGIQVKSDGEVAEFLREAAGSLVSDAIPIYGLNGTLRVATPTADAHATPKSYVDNGFVAQTTGTYKVYGRGFSDAEYVWSVGYGTNANTIMMRNGQGRSSVEDPIEDKHIANKQYVDGLIAKLKENNNLV